MNSVSTWGLAEWVDLGVALLTPLIAVVVAYIAYQQMRTNRRRLRFELFNARYEVYTACRELILDAGGRKRDLRHERFMEFDAAIQGAEFLLEAKARDFVTQLRGRAQELVDIEEELATKPEKELADKLRNRRLELWGWFRSQLPDLNDAFRSSLRLAAS